MTPVLILHLIIITLSSFTAYLGVRENKWKKKTTLTLNVGYIISFVLVLLFLGFRVNVGRDWDNYCSIYNSVYQQDFSFGETRELGFLAMVRFLNLFGFDFQVFIFASSFLMLFLFFISYKKYYYLLPFGLLVFFLDWGYPVTINTIRQGIAIMAFLNATVYIGSNEDKALLKFLFFILIGALFHYSILAFLPFYYIGRLKLSLKYLLLLCIGVFAISAFVVLPIYEDALSLVSKYEAYTQDNGIVNDESTFGLGAILVLLIRTAPLLAYKHVRKNSPGFVKYFVLYFIGLCVFYGFYKYMIITRITFYLQFMELFVISYLLYYLFVEKKKLRLIGMGYVFLLVFNFIYTFNDFLVGQLTSNRFSLMFIDFYFRQ